MKKIRLTGKHAVGEYEFALVDDAAIELLGAYKWKATPPMSGGHRYAVRNCREAGKHKTVYMHRVVAGAWSGIDVDHINHDTLDNRGSNLRCVSRSQNIKNRKPVSVRGVCRGCGASFVRHEMPSGTEVHTKYCGEACRPSPISVSERAARDQWKATHGKR